jgi:glutathionylspermidine synthase
MDLLSSESRSHEWEATVTAVDSLMLDAKQAIMEEHHRRFQSLYQEGRWEEALQQIHVTLSCAADLLNESLQILNEALDGTAPYPSDSSTSSSTTTS